VSFVDFHSLRGRHPDDLDFRSDEDGRRFGGTIAPILQLGLDASRAWIVGTAA
jgi:hypothetical protein